ncbi:MAG: hypothetical protein QQN61_08675, partial [Nitrosopumilus sp.]
LMGFLAFALLSISILSYGVNGSVFAEEHNIPPVFIESDLTIYSNGSQVVISGQIKDYESSLLTAGAITYLIKSPDNNIVTIGQLSPNSDGSFQFTFTAGGNLWKLNGDYMVEVQYGADKSEIAIDYVGGKFVGSPVDKEPEPVDKEPEPVDKEPEPVDKEPEPVDKEPEP